MDSLTTCLVACRCIKPTIMAVDKPETPEVELDHEGNPTFEVMKKDSSSETMTETDSNDKVDYAKGHIDDEGTEHVKHILNDSKIQ